MSEEFGTADLTGVNLTRRRGFINERRISEEIHQHPILIGTQEASFGTVGADRSIISLISRLL